MKVIEFFSCSGGMAEGARRAGLPVTTAFDRDADACASYAANLGHQPIRLDVRDLLRMVQAGLSFGPIDLLVADPPCTPWSRAGRRRGVDDPRDMLGSTVELIRLLRPTAYMIANVPGLDDERNWSVVQRTIGSLGHSGYCARDFVRLDAADYGVPQRRVRPFWFGHRVGPCLTWPSRTHGDAEACAGAVLPGALALQPWVTCREALAQLTPVEMGRPVRLRWKDSSDHAPSSPSKPARTLTTNSHSDGALLAVSDSHPPSHADRPSHTIAASRPSNGAAVLEWPWDRPSTVVCAGEVLAPFGRNGREGESQRGHERAIKLSPVAAALLQGFPRGWHFAGQTKASVWSQIGQAMPPPLAAAVFGAVRQWLDVHARQGGAA